MIIKPRTPKNRKKSQIDSWYTTKTEKLKDCVTKTTFNNINPRNNSKFNTKRHALTEANTAYLFFEK
jgi:DNA phosphorothioation-dependent restriction protein DptG